MTRGWLAASGKRKDTGTECLENGMATSFRAAMGRHTLIVSVEPVPMMMPAMNVRMLARPQSPMVKKG